jgi:hypothetical protein
MGTRRLGLRTSTLLCLRIVWIGTGLQGIDIKAHMVDGNGDAGVDGVCYFLLIIANFGL